MDETRQRLDVYAAQRQFNQAPEFIRGEAAPRAFQALRSVLDLHLLQEKRSEYGAVQVCLFCSSQSYREILWPCRTVEAINEVLPHA
ncbi:hypothetical protein [Amycolatopsis sp. CFH S0078]|uniref:hypothetical protein n=1 Tax=Amycolatopsis sp. CFH S0078 TaxID=1644108 RepID=UPI00106E0C1B|nr:hypothetical protein [Amycolatopsis sp. CFH S0078]